MAIVLRGFKVWHFAVFIPIFYNVLQDPSPGCPTCLLLDGILISWPFGGIVVGGGVPMVLLGFVHVGIFVSRPDLSSYTMIKAVAHIQRRQMS